MMNKSLLKNVAIALLAIVLLLLTVQAASALTPAAHYTNITITLKDSDDFSHHTNITIVLDEELGLPPPPPDTVPSVSAPIYNQSLYFTDNSINASFEAFNTSGKLMNVTVFFVANLTVLHSESFSNVESRNFSSVLNFGNHTRNMTINATIEANNSVGRSKTRTQTTINNTPTKISIDIGPQQAVHNVPFTFNVTVNDTDAKLDGEKISWDNNGTFLFNITGAGLNTQNGSIIDVPLFNENGTWNITINASDGISNDTTSFLYTIQGMERPDVTTMVFDQSLYFTDDQLDVTVTYVNNSQHGVNVTAYWYTNGTLLHSETFEDTDGSGANDFKLNEGNFTRNQTVEVYVDVNNSAGGSFNNTNTTINNTRVTILVTIGTLTANIGKQFTYNITAVDPDAREGADVIVWDHNDTDLFNITASGPGGLNGSIIDIPVTGQEGVHNISLNVSDCCGTSNISLSFLYSILLNESITIRLNGVAADRKYEYGSNVTVDINQTGTEIICLIIGDATNGTCSPGNFTRKIPLHPIKLKRFNNTNFTYPLTALTGQFGFGFDTEMDFGEGSFAVNVSKDSAIRNLYLKRGNVTHATILGVLNGSSVTVDKFDNDSIDNLTLEFITPGILSGNINMSNLRFFNGTMSLRAEASDPIPLSIQYNFTNASQKAPGTLGAETGNILVNDSVSVGRHDYFTLEPFRRNISGRWNVFDNGMDVVEVVNSKDSTAKADHRIRVNGQCDNVAQNNGHVNGINLNLSRFKSTLFEVEWSLQCSVGLQPGSSSKGSMVVHLSSGIAGTDRVVLFRKVAKCSAGPGVDSEVGSAVLNLTHAGGGEWYMTTNAGETTSVTFLRDDVNIQLFGEAECDGDAATTGDTTNSLYQINASGFGNLFSGADHNYSRTFNMTTQKIFNTSTPVVRAKMRVQEFDETDGDVNFLLFMSTNGTDWESVQNNQFNKFTMQGQELYGRVTANSTNKAINESSFAITQVYFDIVTGFPENVTIDFGQDGDNDIVINVSINNTNQPYHLDLDNATGDMKAYLDSGNCSGGFTCLVPFSVSSRSAGTLIIYNLSINQTAVNISLNMTDLEQNCDSDNCNFTFNVSTDGTLTGKLELYNLLVEYLGNANISLMAEMQGIGSQGADNRSILVFFSKFNLTSIAPWFEFFPQTNNSKNVQPFGQDDDSRFNLSIFNFTIQASTEDVTIWHIFNESHDACVDLFVSPHHNRSENITHLNHTDYQPLVENITVGTTKHLYAWVNLTNCPYGTFIQDPWSFFEGACSDCVPVWRNTTG